MKLKRTITAVHYSIEIPMETYTKLEDWETDQPTCSTCLYDILEKTTAARNVDYSGHFGNFIYFSLNSEDNTRTELRKIHDTIKEHIEKNLS